MPIAGWGSHGAESDREYEFSFYTKDRDLFFRLMTEVEQMEKEQLKWLKKDDNALKDDGTLKDRGAKPFENPRDNDDNYAKGCTEGRCEQVDDLLSKLITISIDK